MASFNKPDQIRSILPTKKNYLRSTRNTQTDPYTCSNESVTEETYEDGNGNESSTKLLQCGEVIAKITTGPEAGSVGPYQVGATDGRADSANIIGLNDTYLPWQLNERDVDIAVLYHGVAMFGWCTIRDATGARVPITAAVADAMYGKRGLDVNFK